MSVRYPSRTRLRGGVGFQIQPFQILSHRVRACEGHPVNSFPTLLHVSHRIRAREERQVAQAAPPVEVKQRGHAWVTTRHNANLSTIIYLSDDWL